MKRKRLEEEEETPLVSSYDEGPFTTLPPDIQERIILENKACEVARVSKFWFSIIIKYPLWYENIRKSFLHQSMNGRKVYLVDYSQPQEESETVVTIPELMTAIDGECTLYHHEFKNRLGLFLRKAFLMYMRDREVEKRRGSLMFNSILTYLRHSRENASLTITNFHPRDFRINFYEKDHRYNLLI